MTYPDFFTKIPEIQLNDPLSEFLGTFEKGRLNISYLDVVKGSGHSCPTVAGAYLMAYHGLKELFPEGDATRGNIKVQFKEALEEGTTGVVSNVIAYITGATDTSGFKGINGKFARHDLMSFNQAIDSLRFTRTDTKKSIDIFYDPSSIKADAKQMQLMQAMMQGVASKEEKIEFGKLWQDRVKRIFENKDSVVEVVEV